MSNAISAAALAVAIVIGFLQWRQNRRVGRLQERLAELELERRRDEMAPVIELDYDRGRSAPSLLITNAGSVDYQSVIFAIVDHPNHPSVIRGIEVDQEQQTVTDQGALGALHRGATAAVRVVEDHDGGPGELRLRLVCRGQGTEWVHVARCEVPGYPHFHSF